MKEQDAAIEAAKTHQQAIDFIRDVSIECSESLPREIVSGRTWKDALAKAKEDLCLI